MANQLARHLSSYNHFVGSIKNILTNLKRPRIIKKDHSANFYGKIEKILKMRWEKKEKVVKFHGSMECNE